MQDDIHVCPRCELRFVGTVELIDHLAMDHRDPDMAPPPRPERIVVPLDPARPPSAAVPVAVSLAKASGAPLELIAARPGGLGPQTPSAYLTTRARAARRAGVDLVGHKCLEGPDPAAAILEYLACRPCSLLCMASHGRSAIGEALLGSVSEAVVRRAPVPVVLVGPEIRDPDAPIEHVVVGIEGDALGAAVLEVARTTAELVGADLTLVQVVDEDAVPADVVDTGYLHRLAAGLPGPADYETVRNDDPVAGLLDAVGEQPGTMLVVGTHARSGLRRAVLGSVALELVRAARWPVLVVPPALLEPDRS